MGQGGDVDLNICYRDGIVSRLGCMYKQLGINEPRRMSRKKSLSFRRVPGALDRVINGVLPSCRNCLTEEECGQNKTDIKPESTVRRARTISQEWMTYR
jgi:hypothetical protein